MMNIQELQTIVIKKRSAATWTKRKPITITNSGSALTDYQQLVTVDYDPDMQTDFSDIRFRASDGTTELPFWLESKIDSTTAVFYVKVPAIAGTGVFDQSDTYKRGLKSAHFSQTAGTDRQVWHDISPDLTDVIVEADFYDSNASTGMGLLRIKKGTYLNGIGVYSGSSTTKYVTHNRTYSYVASNVDRSNAWNKFSILNKSDSTTSYFVNNVQVNSTLTGQFNGVEKIQFSGLQTLPFECGFDDIRVRKYSATVPTVAFGAEEAFVYDMKPLSSRS